MDTTALTPSSNASPRQLTGCLAPAKLNLFLHVTGRRADGYHLLQTAFRMLDWGDTLDFTVREDGEIRRLSELPGVDAENDIVVRAARLLQNATHCRLGADITVHKVLPMGGGLGGGSSDAATTLMALNHLWGTGLSREALQKLGLTLGADVPFFIFGRDAFAEGVGEEFQPLALKPSHYVVISPGVSISTAEIFSAEGLTRDTSPIKIADFTASYARNDLQKTACNRYPEVAEAIEWLTQFAPARMTGSGACVFAAIDSEARAESIVEQCPTCWKAWKTLSLPQHPLYCLGE